MKNDIKYCSLSISHLLIFKYLYEDLSIKIMVQSTSEIFYSYLNLSLLTIYTRNSIT